MKKLLFLILLITLSVNVSAGKGRWSKQEYQTLLEAIERYGTKNWSEVAKLLPGRTGRSCRERYYNFLSPTVSQRWTKEEEEMVSNLYNEIGPKWSTISQQMGGTRSANSIKNRFYIIKKNSCKFSGGCYNDVKRCAGYDTHHLISKNTWKRAGLPLSKAICISMPHEAHEQTRNFAHSKEAKKYRSQELEALKSGDPNKIWECAEKSVLTPIRNTLTSPLKHAKDAFEENVKDFILEPME